LIVITMIALPIVVARAHVGVRLYSDRLMIAFWPIWHRTFPLEQVTRVDTSQVSAMGDYMGGGVRKGHDGRPGLLMGTGTGWGVGHEVDAARGGAMGDGRGVGLGGGHDGGPGLLRGNGTGVEVDRADGTKYTVVHPEQEEAEEVARLIEEYRARNQSAPPYDN